MTKPRPTDLGPADRQWGETSKAYAAFRTYLDLGPDRSLAKASQALHKSVGTLRRWSVRWRWVERVRQIEDERIAEREEALRRSRLEAAERHARVGSAIGTLAFNHLIKRYTEVDAEGNYVYPIRPDHIARLLDVAAELERQALGIGKRVELTGKDGGPVEMETSEDIAGKLLARIAALAEAAEQAADNREPDS
jgi:hypothetical protein